MRERSIKRRASKAKKSWKEEQLLEEREVDELQRECTVYVIVSVMKSKLD